MFDENNLKLLLQNNEVQMILRLLLATVLGGLIGLERERGDRPAGLRTHTLVCVGSALFTLVSIFGFGDTTPIHGTMDDMGARRDSARIAAQVVSGIGFLGAGTIIRDGISIKGLTTAASLWMVSAIGLAVGSGMYIVSTAGTLIALFILVFLHSWEEERGTKHCFLHISAMLRPNVAHYVCDYVRKKGVKIKNININNTDNDSTLEIELYVKYNVKINMNEVVLGLHDINDVLNVEVTNNSYVD